MFLRYRIYNPNLALEIAEEVLFQTENVIVSTPTINSNTTIAPVETVLPTTPSAVYPVLDTSTEEEYVVLAPTLKEDESTFSTRSIPPRYVLRDVTASENHTKKSEFMTLP